MFFVDYSTIEEKVFKGVQKYFETLPPIGTDDYKNAFYDVVAQYGGGGESYMFIGGEFDRLVELQLLVNLQCLQGEEKEELTEHYETHFLHNYYDVKIDGYYYTDDDLASELSGRFKAWVDDNFNLDEMLEEEEEDDDDGEEEDEDEDEEYEDEVDDQENGSYQ